MAKQHVETDFVQPVEVTAPEGQFPAGVDHTGELPVLFGNEGYVSDHRGPHVDLHHTQAEWLEEATEIKTVLERGDRVSYQTIEMLFLDAYDVIAGFTPPATRSKKNRDGKDEDDDDQNKRERG